MEQLLNPKRRRGELERVVELTQRHMGVDVVFISELNGDGQVCRAVAGDGEPFGITRNGNLPDGGLAGLLLAGEIPSVIRDVASDARIPRPSEAHERAVGSFVGVPLRLSDGVCYGALCCLSERPNRALGARDVRFMALLGELVLNELDQERSHRHLRADILRLIKTESVAVAYQPIFDLRTDRCIGIEALARFPEPFTRPDRTLAAAESLGLGLELEELVVRRAWDVLARLAPDQFLALNRSR